MQTPGPRDVRERTDESASARLPPYPVVSHQSPWSIVGRRVESESGVDATEASHCVDPECDGTGGGDDPDGPATGLEGTECDDDEPGGEQCAGEAVPTTDVSFEHGLVVGVPSTCAFASLPGPTAPIGWVVARSHRRSADAHDVTRG